MPLADSLLESTARAPLFEGVEVLKTIALSNRFALRNLITLYNCYRGDDPQLTSKEAKTAMQGILQAAYDEYPGEVALFGVMRWEPNEVKFGEFLSSVGDKTLAQFLGISGEQDIPGFESDPGDFDSPESHDSEGLADDGEEPDPSNAPGPDSDEDSNEDELGGPTPPLDDGS